MMRPHCLFVLFLDIVIACFNQHVRKSKMADKTAKSLSQISGLAQHSGEKKCFVLGLFLSLYYCML